MTVTLVFDLDETLAQMAPMFFFVDSLRLYAFEQPAYRAFLKHVLSAEKQEPALGLIRPGLLSLFEQIQQRRAEGRIQQVILYSNNGHLKSLEFIRDLLHLHLHIQSNEEHPLIRACIHWYHPARAEEKRNHTEDTQKTWEGLKACLSHEQLPPLDPATTYFYDDLEHTDMRTALGDHYIRVEPYSYHADPITLADLYRAALRDAELSPAQLNRMLDKIEHEYRTGDLDDIDQWIERMTRLAEFDVEQSKAEHGTATAAETEAATETEANALKLPEGLRASLGGSRKRKSHSTRKARHQRRAQNQENK